MHGQKEIEDYARRLRYQVECMERMAADARESLARMEQEQRRQAQPVSQTPNPTFPQESQHAND